MIFRGTSSAAARRLTRRLAWAVASGGVLHGIAWQPAYAQHLASAESPAVTAADCGYVRCALGIAPVWNGLEVVQGPARHPVANLNFFWPRRVGMAFSGDSARAYATRALQLRRAAAALTDVGGMLLSAGLLRGAHAGELRGANRLIAATGAGAFALSVPLHFSADGWLSRAVWWHNAAFAR